VAIGRRTSAKKLWSKEERMTIDERLEALTVNLELTARDLEAHKDETRKRIEALHDFALQLGEQIAHFAEHTKAWQKATDSWVKTAEARMEKHDLWIGLAEARLAALDMAATKAEIRQAKSDQFIERAAKAIERMEKGHRQAAEQRVMLGTPTASRTAT
jgi:hypothetical protein